MKSLFLILCLLFVTTAFGLSKEKIRVGSVQLEVEVARTEAEHERGLMFRKKLSQNEGMIFIFQTEKTLNFWMKNTFIDLDIGYFNQDKTLVDIQTMKAVTSELQVDLPTYPSKSPAKYALEVPKGWFKNHKIKVGDKLVLQE